MSTFNLIKQLAKKQGKSLSSIALELGFSEKIFYIWQKTNPKAVDLAKVADYFGVSVDYLLGRTNVPHLNTQSTNLNELIYSATTFDDAPITESDREYINALISAYINVKRKEDK